MSIRLNKAIRELNIGLQTAVEFLEKKPNLGEVKGDPNFKLHPTRPRRRTLDLPTSAYRYSSTTLPMPYSTSVWWMLMRTDSDSSIHVWMRWSN